VPEYVDDNFDDEREGGGWGKVLQSNFENVIFRDEFRIENPTFQKKLCCIIFFH
jgi:hypothetical protein